MKNNEDDSKVRKIAMYGICDYKCSFCPLMNMCYCNKNESKKVIAETWLVGKK